MIIPLWEWSLTRDADGGSAGVSDTQHGAMDALSRALIAAGRPSSGQVAQIKLRIPVHQPSFYMRGFPARTAVYDGTVIQWS